MDIKFGLVITLLICGAWLSVRTGKLNVSGAITGSIIGSFIYLGAGFTGIAMLAAFFLLGTLATSWKMSNKATAGLAEENKGRRTASQVIANGGVAAILGLFAWLYGEHAIMFRLMMAGSFASATADTLSSELGNYYGKKFYNVISLKPDTNGLNGVVSLEGTLIGIAGSAFIAFIYGIAYGWTLHVLWIIVAGTIGNFSDSILGATLERKNQLNNNAVNFLNTLIAALAAGIFK
jgi:uncharacterized protein (TIGR00297 family)